MHAIVMNAWKQVFPHSRIHMSRPMGGLHFRCMLAEDAHECANGIMENDPLSYRAAVDGTTFKEYSTSLTVAPPVGSHLVYGSVHMRRKTIKNADHDKLVKRFEELKHFILEHKYEMINLHFNITEKVG